MGGDNGDDFDARLAKLRRRASRSHLDPPPLMPSFCWGCNGCPVININGQPKRVPFSSHDHGGSGLTNCWKTVRALENVALPWEACQTGPKIGGKRMGMPDAGVC